MCVGGGGTGGLVVGTPVYNTSGCEIDPQQCRCSPPSCWCKARVDKTTDCGIYNSGGPGVMPTPLILVPQSVLL